MGGFIAGIALICGTAVSPAAAQPAPADTAGAPTVAQRLAVAADFDQFVAADTTRQQEWRATYVEAAGTIASLSDRVRGITGHWHLLIVAESWCPDAVNSVPYIARLGGVNPAIEVRLLRKSQAPELLALHQLDGRSATPLVILLDGALQERGAWIERPAGLRALVQSKEGRVCEDTLKEAVRDWRRADQGRAVLDEVLALIEHAAAAAGASPN